MTPAETDEACQYLARLFPTAAQERTAALADRFEPFGPGAVRLCVEAHRATSEFLVEPVLLALIREQAGVDGAVADRAARAARTDAHSRQYLTRRAAGEAAAASDRARVVAVLSALPPGELRDRRAAALAARRDLWPGWLLARLEYADPLESPTLGAAIVKDLEAA